MPSITTGFGHRERAPLDRFAQRYHVYRSCKPLARLREHLTKTTWAAGVTEIEGHGPYTRGEAVRRERADILRMKPAHNIDGVVKNTGRKIDVV